LIKAQFLKNAQQAAKEGRNAADTLADGVIIGVGLISRKKPEIADSEEKH
jgi:NADH dehydrogenase (ubiquinone) Fe-S protein 5